MDEPLTPEAPGLDDQDDDAEIQEFLAEANNQFSRDLAADQYNRSEAYDDIRFMADPASQWLEGDRAEREKAGRPCPVLGRLNPFLKQITNDIRLNKPSIEVKPVENDDRGAADCIEGLVRHVEKNSQARYVYATWAEHGVECGIGHVRGIITPGRLRPEQRELKIESIHDPLSVVWDRSSVERDRSDARRCWVIDYLAKADIDDEYRDSLGEWPDETEAGAWMDWAGDDADEVRVVEYYCVKNARYRTFEHYDEMTGGPVEIELGEGDEGFDGFGMTPVSETTRREVRVWLLTQGKILAGGLQGILVPGERIPVFPYIASEKRVGRKVIRKGLVRDAKDSVRLQNWATALLVEAMAASPKPKWVGPSEAFEGVEDQWDAAASSAKPWIPYNSNAKAAPQYSQPPVFNPGIVDAMNVFDENIKRVTGIYDASLGARSNETSGRAIIARERQGDTATYDYIDQFLYAVESLGRWLVDVIPLIYNDERTLRIVGRNDEEKVVTLNAVDDLGNLINPVERGIYDVEIKAGPAFSTRREEAAVMMMEMARSSPAIAPILMDMIVEMQDWPNAEKVASRLKLMLPPQVQMAEGVQGPPMPQPEPDPKVMAGAMKDMAAARKTNLESAAMAMSMGMPVSPSAPVQSGMNGQGAPPQGAPPLPGLPMPA